MPNTCAICGKEITGGIALEGVLTCLHPCSDELRKEIERLRAEGRPVDVRRIARQIYKAKSKIKVIEVPDDLWIAAKHKALDEGITLKALVADALSRRVDSAHHFPNGR